MLRYNVAMEERNEAVPTSQLESEQLEAYAAFHDFALRVTEELEKEMQATLPKASKERQQEDDDADGYSLDYLILLGQLIRQVRAADKKLLEGQVTLAAQILERLVEKYDWDIEQLRSDRRAIVHNNNLATIESINLKVGHIRELELKLVHLFEKQNSSSPH